MLTIRTFTHGTEDIIACHLMKPYQLGNTRNASVGTSFLQKITKYEHR